MKYFAILMLPQEIDATDAQAVERAVSVRMRPYKMWEDDVPAERGHWDWYWCCTKEWMTASGHDCSAYPGVSNPQAPIVFPVDQLPPAGVTDSIITPDGQWHRSKSTLLEADPLWEARALALCRSYPGRLGALLYCHG